MARARFAEPARTDADDEIAQHRVAPHEQTPRPLQIVGRHRQRVGWLRDSHVNTIAVATVEGLVHARQWQGTFFGRAIALFGVQLDLRRAIRALTDEGHARAVDPDTLRDALVLAREAHRTALTAAHYEDLRAVLSTWRYLHRWLAVLMVVLIIVHVVYALAYGVRFSDRSGM